MAAVESNNGDFENDIVLEDVAITDDNDDGSAALISNDLDEEKVNENVNDSPETTENVATNNTEIESQNTDKEESNKAKSLPPPPDEVLTTNDGDDNNGNDDDDDDNNKNIINDTAENESMSSPHDHVDEKKEEHNLQEPLATSDNAENDDNNGVDNDKSEANVANPSDNNDKSNTDDDNDDDTLAEKSTPSSSTTPSTAAKAATYATETSQELLEGSDSSKSQDGEKMFLPYENTDSAPSYSSIVSVSSSHSGASRLVDDDERISWSRFRKREMMLSTDTALRVMDHAHMVLTQRLQYANQTPELDLTAFDFSLARFEHYEVNLGRLIAYGNFADIYSIDSYEEAMVADDTMMDNPMTSSSPTSNELSSDDNVIKSCTRLQQEAAETIKYEHHVQKKRFVVKVLRAHLLGTPPLYATGAADILTEGTLLSALSHPHIMAIRGRSVAGPEGFASGRRDSFFLILDRLNGTLGDLMRKWHEQVSQLLRTPLRSKQRRMSLLGERLRVMAQLADALQYLQEKNILHRDLKASNVGIDDAGNVKLLDFGLAKVLPNSKNNPKERFQLTGNTGSIRYMAPEIGRNEPYNLTADIYSFSILLFEVVSLNRAWKTFQPQEIRDKVHMRKNRPALSMFWPGPIRELLKSTWSDTPSARLPMHHVHSILVKQCDMLCPTTTTTAAANNDSISSNNDSTATPKKKYTVSV